MPGFGGEVVLFVGVWDEGVVGCHHGYVQVHEVAEEWGFVGAWVAGRDWGTKSVMRIYKMWIGLWEHTPLVNMGLDIPMSVDVPWIVLLHTSSFNLLETPLWEVDSTCSKVAIEVNVLQSERVL